MAAFTTNDALVAQLMSVGIDYDVISAAIAEGHTNVDQCLSWIADQQKDLGNGGTAAGGGGGDGGDDEHGENDDDENEYDDDDDDGYDSYEYNSDDEDEDSDEQGAAPSPSYAAAAATKPAFGFSSSARRRHKGLAPVKPVFARETSDKVIDGDDLVAQCQRELVDTAETFGLPLSATTQLLRAFHWSSEKLIAKFLTGGLEAVCAEANIDPASLAGGGPGGGGGGAALDPGKVPAGGALCFICCEDTAASDLRACANGHSFCADCWKHFLEDKIKEGNTMGLACMQPDCGVLLDEAAVRALVSAPMFAKCT